MYSSLENRLIHRKSLPYLIINLFLSIYIILGRTKTEIIMTDVLALAYPWIKSIHIISVISWMAGIFYLPRLFVHHSENVKLGGETHDLFCMMERKLLKVIMTPAMAGTWIFGLLLVATPGIVDWSQYWPWVKAACVIGMSIFHEWLAGQQKRFVTGDGVLTGRRYRIMNEVPTVLMILIVVSVVVKY
jgi:putative membrane protein